MGVNERSPNSSLKQRFEIHQNVPHKMLCQRFKPGGLCAPWIQTGRLDEALVHQPQGGSTVEIFSMSERAAITLDKAITPKLYRK